MFQIDLMSRIPIYEQLIEQAEQLILTGILPPGTQLPSVRSLSVQLAVNPNTVQKAYTELVRRGLIVSATGRGCFVREDVSRRFDFRKQEALERLIAAAQDLSALGMSREEIVQALIGARKEKGEPDL